MGNDSSQNRIIFKGIKSGKNNVTLVFSYIDQFPLITKLKSYTLWRSMHNNLIDKLHLKKENLPKLLSHIKEINNR